MSINNLVKKVIQPGTISVDKGLDSTIDVVFKDNSGFLLKKGEDKNILENINIPESISAPIIQGQKLGEITYSNNESVLATIELVAKENVNRLTLGNMLIKTYTSWFNLNR